MKANTTNDNGLWSDLRALPGAYWVLFSGTLINRFGHFIMPFLALYLGSRDYAPWVTSVALGTYGLGGLIANFLGGYAADRYGRKPTILAACIGGAITMLVMSAVSDAWAIIACSFSVGLTGAMYFPAASALLTDIVGKDLRVRAFGCQRLATNLGFAVGMACAGFLAEYSFKLLFYIDAATTLTLCGLIFFGINRVKSTKATNASWKPALIELKTNKAFQRCLIANFCIAIVFFQVTSSWGLFIIDAGHSKNFFGYLAALNGLMVALLELPLTSVTKRHNPVRVMVIGYAVIGIGMGMNLIGDSAVLLILVTLTFTFGEMISLPIAHSFLAELAPDEMRGRCMGLLGVSWSTAMMLGPSLGIALYGFSPALLWTACLLLGLIAAATTHPLLKK